MIGYYGRVDVEHLPPRELIAKWRKQAKSNYRGRNSSLTFERFEMDYVWSKIADYQEEHKSPGEIVGDLERLVG